MNLTALSCRARQAAVFLEALAVTLNSLSRTALPDAVLDRAAAELSAIESRLEDLADRLGAEFDPAAAESANQTA